MPVIKGSYSNNFTVVPNSTLKDTRLSFEARGVLALMLSMPEDWAMYKSWLCDQCSMTGKDKMTRILKELEVNGYLVRSKQRNDAGMFDSYIWFVYPESTTGNGLAVAGSPVNGKSAPTKEICLQKKEGTKADPIEYEKIKELYNRILGKKLTSIRALTDQRKKHIKARIGEDDKRKDLLWWEHYFYAVSESEFLTGNGPIRDGSTKPWSADIDFLISQSGMVKVIEGKYHA